MRMRFAVIGAGSIGEIHAQTIEELMPEATVGVVVGRDPARTAAAATRHRAEPSLSIERTLARDDIDAIAICTPSGTHAALCVDALEAGNVTMEAARDVVDAHERWTAAPSSTKASIRSTCWCGSSESPWRSSPGPDSSLTSESRWRTPPWQRFGSPAAPSASSIAPRPPIQGWAALLAGLRESRRAGRRQGIQ